MQPITQTERTLLAEIGELKQQYQASPSPELRAAIKAKSEAFHAAHREAAEALAALQAQ